MKIKHLIIATVIFTLSTGVVSANVDKEFKNDPTATEQNLQIESWMLNPSHLESLATETALPVENWMTNLNYLKIETENPLHIEAWMLK